MDTHDTCPICGQAFACACQPGKRQQIQERVRQAILATPTAPSLAIAKRVGVSDKTVTSMRERLIHNSELPKDLERPYRREQPRFARHALGRCPDREPDDFYTTPADAVVALLEREDFCGSVWEPCCGQGHISRVLEANGYPVVSTDLIDRGFGQGGIDFLRDNRKVDNIITNPPYKLALEFAQHALTVATCKVAMLLPVYFLEGIERWAFLSTSPLQAIYIFARRLDYVKANRQHVKACFYSSAWFVWQHGFGGKPALDWIPPS